MLQAIFQLFFGILFMRYASNHKEVTRTRLLTATGALAKKQGFAATGVDALTAAAGMTSGAFYSHFGSKKALLEAIIENELNRSLEMFSVDSAAQFLAKVHIYLSESHVANPESGCAVPALTNEIARAGESTQAVFEQGIVRVKDKIATLVQDEAKAWAVISMMVGAVSMARALPTPEARAALLKGVRQQIGVMVGE